MLPYRCESIVEPQEESGESEGGEDVEEQTKNGGFLEPAIIKTTEFNISLQPSAPFRIDEITECATSKRK